MYGSSSDRSKKITIMEEGALAASTSYACPAENLISHLEVIALQNYLLFLADEMKLVV
jgi:hypothetical protein